MRNPLALTGGFRFFRGVAATAILFVCTSLVQGQPSDSTTAAEAELVQQIRSLLAESGVTHTTLWYAEPVAFLREERSGPSTAGVLIEEVSLSSMNEDSANGPNKFLLSIKAQWLKGGGEVRQLVLSDTVRFASDLRGSKVESLVQPDIDLWSSIVQPALVAVGAAVVIALFFFVRS